MQPKCSLYTNKKQNTTNNYGYVPYQTTLDGHMEDKVATQIGRKEDNTTRIHINTVGNFQDEFQVQLSKATDFSRKLTLSYLPHPNP